MNTRRGGSKQQRHEAAGTEAALTACVTHSEPPVIPAPGEVLMYDFRPSKQPAPPTTQRKSLKLLSWNIERGMKLKEIIEILKQEDADIIALQEVDMFVKRSGTVDTGREIAASLQMHYFFVSEFTELDDPIREAHCTGGGCHGNAILSRYELRNCEVIPHTHHPYNWARDGHLLREPRLGERVAMTATVITPSGPVQVYNAHFELFCGMLDRIIIFTDFLNHARKMYATVPHQLIAGDFNTLAHSIARLSPNYCKDSLRWRSLGWTEAEWWVEHVFNVFEASCESNTKLAGYPLSSQVLRDIRNPGFYDPFDAYHDVTLINPKYTFGPFELFQGKLDWLLLRDMSVLHKSIGNHDFDASDHKWIAAEVTLDHGSKPPTSFAPTVPPPDRRCFYTRRGPGICTYTGNSIIWSVQMIVFVVLMALLLRLLL